MRPPAGDSDPRSAARRSIARDIFDAVNADEEQDAEHGSAPEDEATVTDAAQVAGTPPEAGAEASPDAAVEAEPEPSAVPRTGASTGAGDPGSDRRARLQRMLEEKRGGNRAVTEDSSDVSPTDTTVAPQGHAIAPRIVPDPLTAPLHELEPDWAPQVPTEAVDQSISMEPEPIPVEPEDEATAPDEQVPAEPEAADQSAVETAAEASPTDEAEAEEQAPLEPVETQAELRDDADTASGTKPGEDRVDVFAALREAEHPAPPSASGPLSDEERRARLARMLREKRGEPPLQEAPRAASTDPGDPEEPAERAVPGSARPAPSSPLDLLARSLGVEDGDLPARSYGTERDPRPATDEPVRSAAPTETTAGPTAAAPAAREVAPEEAPSAEVPSSTTTPPTADAPLEPALAAMLKAMEEQESASQQKAPGARADRRGSRRRRHRDEEAPKAPAATPDEETPAPAAEEPAAEPVAEATTPAVETPALSDEQAPEAPVAEVLAAEEQADDDPVVGDEGAAPDKPLSLEEIIAAATARSATREPRRPQKVADIEPAAPETDREPEPEREPEALQPEAEPEPEPEPTVLQPEPEPEPEPEPVAPAAATAVPAPRRSEPQRTAPASRERRVAAATKDVPPVVEFAPQRATQQLLGMLLAVAFIGTIATGYLAYDDRSTTNMAIAATMGLLTLILWSAHGSADPARLKVDRGVLDIRGKDSHHSFDLASPYTDLEVKGTPGRRGWKVLIQRRSMAPYVIDDSMVDSREFMKVLEHYRAGL